MNPADEIRLRHMLESARDAVSFVRGRTRTDLETDRQLVLALIKAIEIIGEAAGKVSSESQEKIPSIAWPDVIGMRNRLVHAYYDVNLDIIWSTVSKELPDLMTALEGVLPDDRP